MFELPDSAKADRFVPKTKFYERIHVSTAVRDEFTDLIGRITWQYKLSESTLNIPATEAVQEIQIFQIDLKQKVIPSKALAVIDKAIPYPILFVLKYSDDICLMIQHKLDAKRRYYKTEWNYLPELNFTGANIEAIYQRIITALILADDDANTLIHDETTSFDDIVATNTKREQLQKEIAALENKIRSERQFSRKVELNRELQRKKEQLKKVA